MGVDVIPTLINLRQRNLIPHRYNPYDDDQKYPSEKRNIAIDFQVVEKNEEEGAGKAGGSVDFPFEDQRDFVDEGISQYTSKNRGNHSKQYGGNGINIV